MTKNIEIGDRVRSFDFASIMTPEGVREGDELTGERACYVEGTVTGFRMMDGCKRYVIAVEKKVFTGEEREIPADGATVYPPLNGTPKLCGGVSCGVDLIEEQTDAEAPAETLLAERIVDEIGAALGVDTGSLPDGQFSAAMSVAFRLLGEIAKASR